MAWATLVEIQRLSEKYLLAHRLIVHSTLASSVAPTLILLWLAPSVERRIPKSAKKRNQSCVSVHHSWETLITILEKVKLPMLGRHLLISETEKTYSGTAKPIRVQVDSNARDQPSSSLPSASSPTAPPSPWLAHRGPHRNKLSAASDDHDQIISGNSAMNTSDREETPSPPGMTTGLRDQQSQKQLVPADLTEVSTLRNGSSSSSEQRPLQPNDSASVPTPRIFHPPALIPKSTVPTVAMMGHHSVSNYLPTSYRTTAAPAYANSGMTSVSMALTTPEQQLYLAKRVIFYNQARLSATEKNMVLIIQDIKSSSEGYWKDTSFMDNMGSNVPESYYKPQLQMRAAYLWARNCDMVSYPDLVKLLGLPPGFLKCWIWRYAGVS